MDNLQGQRPLVKSQAGMLASTCLLSDFFLGLRAPSVYRKNKFLIELMKWRGAGDAMRPTFLSSI